MYVDLQSKASFHVQFGEIHTVEVDVSGMPVYDGDYTITPKVDAQTLATKDTRMRDDVTIKAIPYFETSNDSGTTIFIGSEV